MGNYNSYRKLQTGISEIWLLFFFGRTFDLCHYHLTISRSAASPPPTRSLDVIPDAPAAGSAAETAGSAKHA
jgi:hypothetical protein